MVPLEDFGDDLYPPVLRSVCGLLNDALPLPLEDFDDDSSNLDDAVPRRIRDIQEMNRRVVSGGEVEDMIKR